MNYPILMVDINDSRRQDGCKLKEAYKNWWYSCAAFGKLLTADSRAPLNGQKHTASDCKCNPPSLVYTFLSPFGVLGHCFL